jgi:hypothetical protein
MKAPPMAAGNVDAHDDDNWAPVPAPAFDMDQEFCAVQ